MIFFMMCMIYEYYYIYDLLWLLFIRWSLFVKRPMYVYYKLCLSVYIIIILGLLWLGSYVVHIYHNSIAYFSNYFKKHFHQRRYKIYKVTHIETLEINESDTALSPLMGSYRRFFKCHCYFLYNTYMWYMCTT